MSNNHTNKHTHACHGLRGKLKQLHAYVKTHAHVHYVHVLARAAQHMEPLAPLAKPP